MLHALNFIHVFTKDFSIRVICALLKMYAKSVCLIRVV